MTELDPDRVREMFWLFSKVLPLGSEDENLNKKIFGVSVAGILPDLAITIGHEATKSLEMLDEYFEFVVDAIKYCRKESNDQPVVDFDPNKIMEHMKKELKEFDETAKPAQF